MRTRTLLLLALACGVAIIVAGAVMLFQLAGQDDIGQPSPIGEPVAVGDMTVTVLASSESGGTLRAAIRIGGVDDADGGAGFRLIASGRPAPPDTATANACGATSVEPVECVVEFDVSLADGESRVLFYERGDSQARWVLTQAAS